MPILNYTTTVSSDKTIGEIQRKLRDFGANAVLIEYGPDNEATSISFRYLCNGVMISFQLPVRLDAIYNILCEQCTPRYQTTEQAARVAWRIIKDWVEAQLAIVEAEQAELVEVFLPYAQNALTGKTLYKSMQDEGFKLLGGPDHATQD